MSNLLIGFIMIVWTVVVFLVSRKIYEKYPFPFTLPILVSTFIMVVMLITLDIPYDTYMIGGKWIEWLLGPAVVALAYPLYKQWGILMKNPIAILLGVLTGSSIGITVVIVVCSWLGFDKSIIFSVIPKNSTTPVAMDVSNSLGGIPALAAVFVMIAGMGGAVLGTTILRWTKINHYLGKGVGMGTASHAIGTSRAMESSEEEGAVSTVSMTLGAVAISILSPILTYILL